MTGGRGVSGPPKKGDIIYERPLNNCLPPQMFKHLTARVVMVSVTKSGHGQVADNVVVINAVDMEPIKEKEVANISKMVATGEKLPEMISAAGNVTVEELATTQPINSMILNGLSQTSLNGVSTQNGLATQNKVKAATGEEVDKFFIFTVILLIPYSKKSHKCLFIAGYIL